MNRETLRSWIPPAALQLKNAYRQTYDDYASALGRCGSPGYLDDDIGQTVARKTSSYFSKAFDPSAKPISIFEFQLMAALLSASRAGAERIRVVDFGGAAGAGYFAIRPLLPPSIKLDWTVVETSAMVVAARQHIRNEELSFESELAAVSGGEAIDLVYSSGALQFTPDPFGFLDRLLSLEARTVAFVRLQSTDESKPFTVVFESTLRGNGPGSEIEGLPADRAVKYPCTFLPKAMVRSRISGRYDVAFESYDASADSKVRGHATTGWSFFGRLRGVEP